MTLRQDSGRFLGLFSCHALFIFSSFGERIGGGLRIHHHPDLFWPFITMSIVLLAFGFLSLVLLWLCI
jgi:hypothetical protein